MNGKLAIARTLTFSSLMLLLLVCFARYNGYAGMAGDRAALRREKAEFDHGRPERPKSSRDAEAMRTYSEKLKKFGEERKKKKEAWEEREKKIEETQAEWLTASSTYLFVYILLSASLLGGLGGLSVYGSEMERAAALFLAVVLVPHTVNLVMPGTAAGMFIR